MNRYLELLRYSIPQVIPETCPNIIVDSKEWDSHQSYMKSHPGDDTTELCFGNVKRTITVPKEYYGNIIQVDDIRTIPSNNDFTGTLMSKGENPSYAFYRNGQLLEKDEISQKIHLGFTGLVSVPHKNYSNMSMYASYKNGILH